MTTFQDFKRNARSYAAIGMAGLVSFACGGKGEEPTPVEPADKFTRVDQDVKMNVIVNPSNSVFTDNGILNEDNSVSYGLGTRVYGVDNSRVATGTSSADNIKFSITVNKDNISAGSNSVKGGEYWLAAINAGVPVITYKSDTPGGDLKIVKTLDVDKKIEFYNHVKEVNLLVQEKSGIRIQGSKFTDNATYLKYIANCATEKSSKVFAQSNVMDVEAKAASFSILNP